MLEPYAPASIPPAARVRGRWLIGLVPVVAAALGGALLLLLDQAESAWSQPQTLSRIEADANALNAVEWATIHRARVEPETRATIDELERSIRAGLGQLASAGLDVSAALETWGVYRGAMAAELALIDAGRIDDAVAADDAHVDPAFGAFIGDVGRAAERAEQDAAARVALVRGLIVVVVVAALAALTVLFRRLSRAGARRGVEDAERRALARTNAALTAEIARRSGVEAELVGAREVAEKASRAKDEFLAVMSHEIRTPMTGVIGMTGLLMETPLEPEQRELAAAIRTSGDTLLQIVNDILDFSKLGFGRVRLESVEHDLWELVDDVVETLASQAEDRGLELATCLRADVPRRVLCDPGRLRQVLLNLVGNAVKFTSRGSVTIELSRAASAGRVRVAVTDTGIGIAAEDLGRLFSAFTQVDGSYARRHGGTGLGLAISRQLVELMGGEIGVESRPDVGSTFWFEVPLTAIPGDAARPLLGTRVLVVDGRLASRRAVATTAGSWGASTSEVETGAAALSAAREAHADGRPFEAILMAMRLADMDALELARRLAEAVPLGGARLVVMTPPGDALRVRRHAPELDRIGTPVRVSLLRTWLEHPPGNAFRRTPHEGTPRVRPRSMQPTRILVAEDNPTNQKYAVALLERMGHRCAVVENGREAVRAALQEAFDLVLMDVMMPEMDGLEATRAIRERELEARPGRHLPIVALTADVLGGARDECMRAGCDDFLEKPVTPSQLEATVSFWLAREPAQAPDADLN